MAGFLSFPYIISVLIAISVHEWAHGFAAYKLGDPTAKYEGRLTLNPISHLDPLGALLFLTVGFGWAKPVPINPTYFNHPKRDTAIVALAGPFSNLVLGVLAFLGLAFMTSDAGPSSMMGLLLSQGSGEPLQQFLFQLLATSLSVNLALMAFNLLPLAPLDGSKILGAFIPWRRHMEYELFMQRGPYILFALILIEAFTNIRIISGWVFGIVGFVLDLLHGVTGFL